MDAGLEALAGALAAGFDDFKTVRTDKSLSNLRKSAKFTVLINRYDEPLINEGAIKCEPSHHTCSARVCANTCILDVNSLWKTSSLMEIGYNPRAPMPGSVA